MAQDAADWEQLSVAAPAGGLLYPQPVHQIPVHHQINNALPPPYHGAAHQQSLFAAPPNGGGNIVTSTTRTNT